MLLPVTLLVISYIPVCSVVHLQLSVHFTGPPVISTVGLGVLCQVSWQDQEAPFTFLVQCLGAVRSQNEAGMDSLASRLFPDLKDLDLVFLEFLQLTLCMCSVLCH